MHSPYNFLRIRWESKAKVRKERLDSGYHIPYEYRKEARMNLNKLARDITLQEGLKNQVSIGQVKEILRIVFTKLDILEIIKIWIKYNKK